MRKDEARGTECRLPLDSVKMATAVVQEHADLKRVHVGDCEIHRAIPIELADSKRIRIQTPIAGFLPTNALLTTVSTARPRLPLCVSPGR